MHQQLQPTSGAECRWRNDSLQGTAIIQTVLASKANKIGDKKLGACITPKRVLSWISDLHRESWWWSHRRRTWGYSCPEFGKENYQKRSPCPHGQLLLPSIFHGPVRRRSLLLWDCPWKKEMHARGNKVLQTEKPRRDHKIQNELIATTWGDKKLCLICQQTRIRMITSVFCVNKKMGQWRMFPVQLLVGSITDSCLELTELTNYECSKSKQWCRYLLWFSVDLAVVNGSIYLDGTLLRGWGGDTYVQVEHHNIER